QVLLGAFEDEELKTSTTNQSYRRYYEKQWDLAQRVQSLNVVSPAPNEETGVNPIATAINALLGESTTLQNAFHDGELRDRIHALLQNNTQEDVKSWVRSVSPSERYNLLVTLPSADKQKEILDLLSEEQQNTFNWYSQQLEGGLIPQEEDRKKRK